MDTSPLNILVIMSDEHNPAVTGCYGNQVVRTPHIDGLAERGVLFENCYCNAPLCTPSRLSFTAGKYASRIGAWNNICDLPTEDYPSLPRTLNAAGVASFLCGKHPYGGGRLYGFTELGGRRVKRNARTGRERRRDPNDLAPSSDLSPRFAEFQTADDSSVLRHDRAVTANVASFLRERRGDQPPFFLLAGYIAPHFPLIVPEESWRPYRGNVPPPVVPEGHLDALARNYRHLRAGFLMSDVPPDLVRFGRELYYGLTTWLDQQVGEVLGALAESAVADNTVVIYTSDHGENLGEHGLWWKSSMYEAAARVPLIISWPARWPGSQRRTAVCSLLDVVQTIVALGGTAAPADWDGDSLLPWLDDGAAPWKDLAVSEYYGHYVASGFVMLRTGPYKYVYHTAAGRDHGPERELYDLRVDPGELHNLAELPTARPLIARLHAALVAELGEDPEVTERRCRSDYAKAYGELEPTA